MIEVKKGPEPEGLKRLREECKDKLRECFDGKIV